MLVLISEHLLSYVKRAEPPKRLSTPSSVTARWIPIFEAQSPVTETEERRWMDEVANGGSKRTGERELAWDRDFHGTHVGKASPDFSDLRHIHPMNRFAVWY